MTASRCRSAALLALMLALALAAASRADAATVQVWSTPSKFINPVDLKPRDLDDGKLSTRVVLPDGYESRKCWPVIFLLHGTGTDTTPAPREWIDQMHADTAGIKAILVIPGGGPMWWTNQWWGGLRHPGWEDWVLQELIPLVERRTNVCAGRAQHSIAGYSMGGYGAALLGAERPDYFGSIASFSGVLTPMSTSFNSGSGDFADIWGPTNGFYAAGHDPLNLVGNLRSTRVLLSAGDGNAIGTETVTTTTRVEEQLFSAMTSQYAAAARKAGAAVTLIKHRGAHTWITWQQDLQRLVAWNPFKPVATDPARWSYTTIATTGRAWNYTFSFKKPPKQLLKLEHAGATLRAYGAGTLTVNDGAGHKVTAKLPFSLKGKTVGKLKNPPSTTPPAAQQLTKVTPTIAPAQPGASDPITVSFTTADALPADMEYGVAYISTGGSCAQQVVARVAQPAKGKAVSVTLSPNGDPAHPRTTWCPGGGAVGLVAVRKGADVTTGTILGYATLTIPAS